MDREDLATQYLDQLPFDPYPVQEEALLAWFTGDQGLLVCAPTGTGKTLIAEAAIFEALRTGQRAYYTTPLIALTEQKLQELRAAAVRWGYSAQDIGLVTGNRRDNPDAKILVVVAEILFNRLLHPEDFSFDEVCSVIMDEFHSFNDPERGIVWEFTLGLLPRNVRTLLLSATVGNAQEFVQWMTHRHQRPIELVESSDRKVPLNFRFVDDALLGEHLEEMSRDRESENRRTPALVFCFNRDECWTVAEQLKGKKVVLPNQQKQLVTRLAMYDWSEGAGPKLKQVLMRGVGVHHAGVLPKYKRIVESLFQEKLLSLVICTETLAAGINLPARSVVIPNLLKGPRGKKKLIEASAAHQMFGRAGRPQFDTQGFVFGLAHEDDVKISRWRVKYDQIPEDTKDPQLRKAKKALKKKMPTRRATQQYWSESQFEKLRMAPPGKLQSRGSIPWRFLVHMLDASTEVEPIRRLIRKRLMQDKQIQAALHELDGMLLTLWTAGYVQLEPRPQLNNDAAPDAEPVASPPDGSPPTDSLLKIERAIPLDNLQRLSVFRGVNPLYGVFLVNQMGIADPHEQLQAMESVLDMPGSVARYVRVPGHDMLPPGPLATTRLDPLLLRYGLATAEELVGAQEEPDDTDQRSPGFFEEEPPRILNLAEKLRTLFGYDFPNVHDVRTTPVWAAGELLEFGGDFNKFIIAHRLQKQEGVLFRHILRLILLISEFAQIAPPEMDEGTWKATLLPVRDQLTESCRSVDPLSTDEALAETPEL